MKFFRTLIFVLAIFCVIALVLTFDSLNRQSINIDLAFTRWSVRPAKAFAVSLALGWVFGVLTAGGSLWRAANERRQLKKAARLAEREIVNLRKMPIHDVK